MRFASCRRGNERFAALVEGDQVRPLAGIHELGADTGVDVLRAPSLRQGPPVPLADVELLPPVPAPGKIICLGLNYRGHVSETGRELPTYPVLFTKFAASLVGPTAPIVKPPESEQVDYEAELAVVIGRRARRVKPHDAMAAVAGFTVANDVTMRDYQYRTHQWLQGKAWPRCTPLGPFLVTPDEVGDGSGLDIRLELNGAEMQSSNTELMIFDVPTTVALVSEFTELQPGDVILTGTPAGVGYRRDPQVFLQPGDRVRVEIEGLGALDNEVAEEDLPQPAQGDTQENAQAEGAAGRAGSA
jgi:acylpyruvate hydrolase